MKYEGGYFYVDHKTSLTPPLLIEVPVPSQESEQLCFCVLRVSILFLSTVVLMDFETVLTVWYFRIVLTVWYFFVHFILS